jgi:hypothetical protein
MRSAGTHDTAAHLAQDPGPGGACDGGWSHEATRGVKSAARPATALRPSILPENHWFHVLDFFCPEPSLNLRDEMRRLVRGMPNFVDRFREVWGMPYVALPVSRETSAGSL